MRILMTIVAMALAAMAWAAPARAQTEITVGHVLSEKSFYHAAGLKFKELMEARSNGRVKVNLQCCGALGNEGRIIQSVRTGVIDAAFFGLGSMESTVPEFRVLSLPHLFDNRDQAERVLRGAMGERLLKLVEPHGMVGLAFGGIFERHIATGNKAINTPADLRGLKIRVLQTPGWVQAYTAVGAQPTPMAYGEVFLALQNGVVDALEVSSDAMLADRFLEVSKHYALTRFHQSTTMFAFSQAKFNALPADVQALIRAVTPEAVAAGLKFHNDLGEEGLKAVRAKGIAVTEPAIGPFREASRPSWANILKDAGPNGQALANEIEAARRASN
ncbi:MAG: TRAP transporter substrate-binding protein [Beijerinckiaceae bacterium]